MSLDHHEISTVLDTLQPRLSGAQLQSIHDDGDHDLYLTLHHRGETHTLLLSTHPRAARLHLLDKRPPAPPQPRASTQRMRKLLGARRLLTLTQRPGDRIITLDFGEHALIAELTGTSANIFLVNDTHTLLTSTQHPSRIPHGHTWTPPTPPPPRPPRERFEDTDDLHATIAHTYTTLLENLALQARLRTLRRALKRGIQRAKRTLTRIEADIERADGADRYRILGDLLAANLHRVSRGQESIEVDNFYEPGTTLTIPLDPRLDPGANLDALYHRYKRFTRSQDTILERYEQTEQRLAHLTALRDTLEDASDLDVLESELRAHGLLHLPQTERQREARALPYRVFHAASGREIRVGRNASANDRLTFSHARGSDLWLHASGWAGSHVILRLGKREEPDHESLLDAATLAAHYSKGRRDTHIEVHVTHQKHVRKHRGAPAGAVHLAGARTLNIRIEPDRLQRLLQS